MITELIYKFLFLSSCLTHTLNASQPDSFFTADCKRDKKVKGERFINYACFVALIIIFIITKAHTRILCYTEMILGVDLPWVTGGSVLTLTLSSDDGQFTQGWWWGLGVYVNVYFKQQQTTWQIKWL